MRMRIRSLIKMGYPGANYSVCCRGKAAIGYVGLENCRVACY